MSPWKRLLAEHAALGERQAAAALRAWITASASPGDDLAQLAALAADPEVSLRQRAIALMTVGMVAGTADMPVPAAAIDALHDPQLVDAVIAHGLCGALTSVLGLAGDAADLRPVRQLIGRRLLAGGERGPHVTALLMAAGDHAAAVQAAADDFERTVQPRAADPDAVALAWAGIFLSWLESDPETMFVPFCRELRRRGRGATDRLLELVALLPHAAPVLLRTVSRHLGEEAN